MAAEPTTTRRTSITGVLAFFLVTVMFATVGTIAGIRLVLAWPSLAGDAPAPAAPTAIIAPRPPAAPISQPAPIVAPAIPGIAQNEATAQAEYDAAVRAAEQPAPLPNTGQAGPVTVQERPADERQGAGANVPTAEPIAPAESNDRFGSKPVLVNPQQDHTCNHGQVWTERGCKNP